MRLSERVAIIIIALLTFVAIIGAAYAQSQGTMNREAGTDYLKADAEMTAAYKHLMKGLDASRQRKLLDAQRAWLKFRDAEARFRASKAEGGSVYPTVHAGYLADLTRARTKQLQDADRTFHTEGDL